MAIVFDSIEGFFKFYLKTLWRRSLVWIVQTSRLIPLIFYCSSNQPTMFLSHTTSQFQSSFCQPNGASVCCSSWYQYICIFLKKNRLGMPVPIASSEPQRAEGIGICSVSVLLQKIGRTSIIISKCVEGKGKRHLIRRRITCICQKGYTHIYAPF